MSAPGVRIHADAPGVRTGPGSPGHPLRVAVVGSGPAGFYAAEALLESGIAVEVDILERLPVPYGLVRHGVAPDHARLKAVTAVFEGIARDPRCRFLGNVELGREVSVARLSALHHAVIVATGARDSRPLGIPGESLRGVHAASDFVGWYNGLPGCADLRVDLSREVAVVVGHGNVAIDVCRILARPVDELRRTDIARHALEALAASRVREIHLVGRRGPVQARFTPKELRELGALPGWRVAVHPASLRPDDASLAELHRPEAVHAARNLEILRDFAGRMTDAPRTLHIHFLRAPVSLHGDGRLEAVELERMALRGHPGAQVAVPTGRRERLAAGLLFASVGHAGRPLPGLPFDARRGTLANREGRIVDGDRPLRGWYAAGWIRRGASGVIGTNRADAVDTVARLLEDLPWLEAPRPGGAALLDTLRASGHPVTTFDDALAIEAAERERGRALGKAAEKFVRVPEMLAVAAARRATPSRLHTESVFPVPPPMKESSWP